MQISELFSLKGLAVLLPFLLVPLMVAMIDIVTLIRSRFKKASIDYLLPSEKTEYSILIPIFGDIKYLKNVEFLKPYGNKVILCTTARESRAFNIAIDKICKEHGFQVFRSEVPLSSKYQKPNPWKLFHKTLDAEIKTTLNRETARDEIIRDSFSVVSTPYCIFIDGDTVAVESIDILVSDFIRKNYDLSSVRVLASQAVTLAEKMQTLEYEIAMDARKVYPWLTSGAAMVAKTEVIRDIMGHHSLFFSGGDIEIGKLAMLLGYHVGHIPFVFLTDVPVSFKALFKQRMAWFGGGFRHAIINFHSYTWRHPFFYFYTTFIVYGLTPLRWFAVISFPQIVPIVYVMYLILLFVFHWRKRSWYFFLFPLYALVQVMVVIPFGVYTYLKMSYRGKNIGLIHTRHSNKKEGRSVVKQRKHVLKVRKKAIRTQQTNATFTKTS